MLFRLFSVLRILLLSLCLWVFALLWDYVWIFGGRKWWVLGLGDGKKSNFSGKKQRWKARERKWVRARRKEPLQADSRRGDTSAQTESLPEGMVVRSGTKTSTAASSAIFCWLMLFRLFSMLWILSLSHCVSEYLLCFGIVLVYANAKCPCLTKRRPNFIV